MNSMKLRVLYLFVTYFQGTNVWAYSTSCSDKLLDVRGVISPMLEQIFSQSLSLYVEERKTYGRNVTMKVKTMSNQILNTMGIFTTYSRSKPTLFFATTSNDMINENELRFPMAASATVVIYNLPGFSKLTLSVGNIVGIYNGNPTGGKFWNSTYIANNNPNFTLPDQPIRPIARLDSDASTALFTQVLSANNANWKAKYGTFFDPGFVNGTCCNTTKWEPDTIYMYGNMTVGMVGIVASIPYSIGYATLPSLVQYTVSRASFNVKTGGDIINPTIASIQAAMRFYYTNSGPNELLLKLESANDSSAYPLSAFTYMVINKSYTGVDCCLVEELIGFLDWYFFTWSDDGLDEFEFVTLLPGLKQRIKRLVLETVTCEGELVYPRYLASKVLYLANKMQSWEIAIISMAVFLIVTVFGFTFYVYFRKKQADETRWMIDGKRVKIVELIKDKSNDQQIVKETAMMTDCSKSMSVSLSSSKHNTNRFGVVNFLKNQMVVGEIAQNNVFLDKLNCRFPQHWSKSAKRSMTRIRNLTNKNVLSLMGVTILNNDTYTIFEHCSKGTLHYVLRTTRYQITDNIKYQFLIDISNGMKYLHQSGIIHGCLNSLTCYLDSSWNVKIAQWQQMSLYLIENPKVISELVSYNQDMYLTDTDLVKFIYIDPQIRRTFNEDVDVYSFGMLLIEIFTKKLPFMTEIEDGFASYGELLTKKFCRNIHISLKLDMLPKRIDELYKSCVSMDNHRPSFLKIHSELKTMAKIVTGIVDIIMDTLEQHAEKLEEKVDERTAELKQVTNRMRALLHEVLPPQIAEKLFNGEPVSPEYYECVTIYFSDIVGFTTISARSTPIEVMTLLNDLWLAFDAVLDQFNVYKVDTIGDAYMVCSGLPTRNGNTHCRHIALCSLALLDKCNRFKIKHFPNESLKIRIGINSGPVTAGVVGSKMPQYCVFGDTVNTAARMESTSEEKRIQISYTTFQLITEYFPCLFQTEYRGEISVKGKGNMKTFWLLGTN